MKIFFSIFLLWCTNAYSIEVSRGMGESTFKSSKERITACSIAENKAINNALINYAGKEFTSTKETRCIDTQKNAYCDYLTEISSQASGTVRSIVDRSRKIKNNSCLVEVVVEIEKSKSINASVKSKRIYLDGEFLDIKIKVGQPLYLYIFNLNSNGVDLLFPNIYNKDELIDDRFVWPGNMFKARGISNVTPETLFFLFSTNRQTISEDIDLNELKQLVLSIPNFEKKVIQHNLVIKRSER